MARQPVFVLGELRAIQLAIEHCQGDPGFWAKQPTDRAPLTAALARALAKVTDQIDTREAHHRENKDPAKQMKKIGILMQRWHRSGADPVYGCGSYYATNRRPGSVTEQQARDAIAKLLSEADAKANGLQPTAEDRENQQELRTILTGIEGIMRLPRGGA